MLLKQKDQDGHQHCHSSTRCISHTAETAQMVHTIIKQNNKQNTTTNIESQHKE